MVILETLFDILSASAGAILGALFAFFLNRKRNKKMANQIIVGRQALEKIKLENEELLKRVAKKFSLYIVSNSTKRYVKFHLKKFGINKNMFKKIYQNNFYAHNTTKTPYYAKILAREKVAPHEAVMIGDSYENDIVPAINMGINGVHIKSLAETTTVLKNLCEGV